MPSIFVASAPGLEDLLEGELAGLGLGRTQRSPGGVSLRGGLETIYRANLESGYALKVLVRLGRFGARHFGELERHAGALPWERWLDGVAEVRVESRRSRLYHRAAIAERIQSAMASRVPAGPSASRVMVRLVRDRCTVSVDTSGELLTRRGYRRGTGKAPLRADLARAVIAASGWPPAGGEGKAGPLGDPLCGSGTIVIEAALMATRTAPGHHRQFGFEVMPCFDERLWASVRERAAARAIPMSVAIVGSDRDEGVVQAARDNARRAGVEVEIHRASLSDSPVFTLRAPSGSRGAVCSNPPYGHRVSRGADPRPLLQRLAAKLASMNGFGLGLVVSDTRSLIASGVRGRVVRHTDHGGTRVAIVGGDAGHRDPIADLS